MSDHLPQTAASFEQRLRERIRESIGELMTDEDLKRIIERGTEDLLFKERSIDTGDRWHPTRVEPPLVVSIIAPILLVEVQKAVSAWAGQHPQLIAEAIKAAIGEGLVDALSRAVEAKFSGAFFTLQQSLLSALGAEQR